MSDKRIPLLSPRILIFPAVILLLSVTIRYLFESYLNNVHVLDSFLAMVVWFASASIFNRCLLLFFFQPLREIKNITFPRILINLMASVIWLVTFILVLDVVFHQSITGIVTTSAVAFGVVGLALRDVLANLFAGIMISIEGKIRVGDWIDVDGRYVGKVVEICSCSTELINFDELTLIIPNSQMTRFPVRNFSYPEPCWRDRLSITLDYRVPYHQVQRVLFSAVQSIQELASVPRRPVLTVSEYTDRGILWNLLYWVPHYGVRASLATRLHQAILRNLYYSGVHCPFPQRVVHESDVVFSGEKTHDLLPILRKIFLFVLLNEDELKEIADRAVRTTYTVGRLIIRQGDQDTSSLFVLHEGLLNVQLDGNVVGQLLAGNVFGELSLLTGAPRSTTVVAAVDSSVIEVQKVVIDRLLHNRPEIAMIMGNVLAERQLANQAAINKVLTKNEVAEVDKQTLAEQIAGRIRGFFCLS
ncbi:MAG: mechanosensitive ion channel family protein [Magnetococcales bacterium]|nr:mechanosensitive ion channel family protein [Magnetococcales bacterium]